MLFLFQSKAKSESVALTIFEKLSPDLYATENLLLFIAGRRGFKSLTKKILDTGFSQLLTTANDKNQYPVQVCLEQKQYGTAAVMLRAMNNRYV